MTDQDGRDEATSATDSVETHQHHVADRASHGLFTG